MDITKRHNISDLYKTLGLSFVRDIDFIILSVPDIHPLIPFESPKLRADYFSFIITKEGSGVYYLDDKRFPFGSRTIYFTNPGHIKSYELYESKDSYIITLSENFLTENVHSEIYSEFPYLLAEIVPPQKIPENEFEEFETLYKHILHEFNKDSEYKNRIIGNLFEVLLMKIKEKFWRDYNPMDEGKRTSIIVKSFKQLLESEFGKVMDNVQNENKHLARNFADKLNIHPNYLNAVIKNKTGRTVNEWISKRTVTVAKSLLLNSALSSKQIAYKLGFSEPTHFSRFFKNNTQLSPGEFRKLKNS